VIEVLSFFNIAKHPSVLFSSAETSGNILQNKQCAENMSLAKNKDDLFDSLHAYNKMEMIKIYSKNEL
jgi:hypothetical protein